MSDEQRNPYQPPATTPQAPAPEPRGAQRHFKTLAQICAVMGLLVVMSAQKTAKNLPPPGPERDGAITAMVGIPLIFFIAAAVFYFKRPKP